MKKLSLNFLLIPALFITYLLQAQIAPEVKWQRALGGSGGDAAYSLQQTADSAYVVAGSTSSLDGDVTGLIGDGSTTDFWIVRLDKQGNLDWQKCYGGPNDEQANAVQETYDHGFIVAGYTNSNDSDVSGNHGHFDYWILKLDSLGNLLWQKCLGGEKDDKAFSIQQTADSGYIVAGYSFSSDGNVTGNHGSKDYWVVKLDTGGNVMWQKSLGGSSNDFANYIQQTTDGGYIVAGFSTSNDGDVTGNHGGEDYWIVKLDTLGNIMWQKSLGGSSDEEATFVQQIVSGYIVAGYSKSLEGDVTGNHGHNDYWIVKLDTGGNIIWEKSYGGSDDDYATSIHQVDDSAYIVSGSSVSNDYDVTGNHGGFIYGDYWIVKLDTAGAIIWEKTYGGGAIDYCAFALPTAQGRLILAGYSNSIDGDVTNNHGAYDFWIVLLKLETLSGISSLSNDLISIYPDPVQDQLVINLETPVNDPGIRVYDVQGSLIALPAIIGNSRIQLNTGSLNDGYYTLQIINNKTGEIELGKFVKGE